MSNESRAEMLRQMAAIADRMAVLLEDMDVANGASKVMFFVESTGEVLGEYLMYNPPVTGDDVTWGEATYTVVRRNVDVQDNFVRITVRVSDEH